MFVGVIVGVTDGTGTQLRQDPALSGPIVTSIDMSSIPLILLTSPTNIAQTLTVFTVD